MGSSQSALSTHFAHWPEGKKKHRFEHVASNKEQGQCGMCLQATELGPAAYRCVRCRFVLHADCYSRPETIADHFAHSSAGGHRHPLKLSGEHSRTTAAGRRRCNICSDAFDGGAFVYGCSHRQCHGFYAHPRCAILPQTTMMGTLHGHTLTLLSPPRWTTAAGTGRSSRNRRRCINAAGNCRNAKVLDNDAMSYQCNQCQVELCVACQLPGGGGGGDGGGGRRTRAHHQRGTGDGRWKNSIIENCHLLGTAIGTSLRAMGCACIGAPTTMPTATKG